MKVALYMRVSTDEQTVENQRIRLHEYSKLRGWEVVKEYKDEGISGSISSRPDLDRMLNDLRDPRRGWKVLIAYKLDRIGRSLPHLIQVVDEINKHDAQFVLSDDPNFDTTTPHGELIFNIFGSIAQYERKLNKQRQREGIRRAHQEGKHMGRPKVHGGKVQRIIRLKEEGKSLRIIAKETEVSKSTVERIIKESVRKGTPPKSMDSASENKDVSKGSPFGTESEGVRN